MTQKDLFPHTISSPQVTPVSRSVSQVNKGALKMTATSGRTSLELLHTKDRLGAFSKTFMVTSPWASTKCCLTWKPKATPQGRLLFQLAVSTLPIEETGSGLWPTPLAQEAKHGTVTDWEMTTDHAGTKGSLRVAAVKSMWPTPATRDHKGGYQGGRIRNGKVSWDTLDVAVQHTDNQEKTGGQLNPIFVEWLMGYPEGWTDLKD